MKVELCLQQENEDDWDKTSELLLEIHKKHPEAVWQRGRKGYEIFL